MAENGAVRLTVNVPEAAAMLGVSVPTAWAMVHAGTLPAIKCGKRRYVVPRAALLERLLATGVQHPKGQD